MTDWKIVRGTQSSEPSEVDTKSSPTTVYLRRNIKQVEEAVESYIKDKEGNLIEEEPNVFWEYEEREMTKEEYAQYLIVQESTDKITSFQEQTVIDAYTEELILGGVL